MIKALSLAMALVVVPVVSGVSFVQSAYGAMAIDFSDLVEKVSSGVVRVSTTKQVDSEGLELAQKAKILRELFGDKVNVPNIPTVEYGYGTGFFVSADGYILTNHHVVAGADKISITLQDRTELDARLVGSDEASDVAVLKVEGRNFPALTVAQGDTLKVGEPVLAIGSPFGFDYSASAGIVSAKSRSMSREATVPFIQTDVALNQGNSGGPLFNQKGEVVGINSLIFSRTGGHMGLSFSIPIDTAMDMYEQIKNTGKVTRVYMGLQLQDIDRTLAEAYQLDKPQGALITRVGLDSPAYQAGLKIGDVVLSFNGQNIILASDLLNRINRAKPNDKFNLTYLRAGKVYETTGRFVETPHDVATQNATDNGVRLGLRLKELTQNENRLLNEFGVKGGVIITSVDITGLASRAGLMAGDVIVHLNHLPTNNIQTFEHAFKNLPKQGVVTVGIIRDGMPAILGLRIE
ncbi:Do family serine endopeptidase [Moraxella oblonga]|uniref:Do family serine endopeptidase n=1 Tax=Moraxella oblonga TaxID=200413 RepID=UPI00082B9C95|nr:Do family serine endopeptidase [Moraxella oblonga]